MQIEISEVERHMVIHDGTHDILITEVWPNQGRGLGVVIKGKIVDSDMPYFRRFLDPEVIVEVRDEKI